MKRKIFIAIVLLILLACTVLLARGCVRVSLQEVVLEEPLDVQTNYIQYCAHTKLFASNGRLYIFPVEDLYLHWSGRRFYALDRGRLTIAKEHDHVTQEFAVKDGILYYRRYDPERRAHCNYAYDLLSGEEYFLTEIYADIQQTIQGDLFVRNYVGGEPEYYPIEGTQLKEKVDSVEPRYPLGDYTYTVEQAYVVAYTPDGERIELENEFRYMALVPCERGLLLFSRYYPNSLYLIQQPGTEPELLMKCPSFLEGGIAVYKNSVYVSFDSWEDSPEDAGGTYRIDLEDFSKEKISDEGYRGLYIFDDTGIFACDKEGSIVKLDWNGKVTKTLLKEIYPWDISILLPLALILIIVILGCVWLKTKSKKQR